MIISKLADAVKTAYLCALILRNNICARRVPYCKEHSGVINILGTGPSLNSSLNKLMSHETAPFFALNDFALSNLYNTLKPSYYVLEDPAYWLPENETNKRDINIRTELFIKIRDITTWEMYLFVPSVLFKKIDKSFFEGNSHIKIVAYNTYTIDYVSTKPYFKAIKKNYIMPRIGNVLGTAIYLSLNKGYDDIRLFGAEHSWTKDIRVNDNNQVCTIKRHFYNEQEDLAPWCKYNKEVFKMHEILGCLRNHFLGYQILKIYSEILGARITNYTEGSYIDAFERKSLGD